MDIPVTLLTVFIIYGIIKYLNEVLHVPSWSKIPLAVLVGIGVASAMAQTDFAGRQEFFDMTLDQMNWWSQAAVGVALGFGAVGLDTTFKTIRNVGENDSPT